MGETCDVFVPNKEDAGWRDHALDYPGGRDYEI
jgi:hypothetical protein